MIEGIPEEYEHLAWIFENLPRKDVLDERERIEKRLIEITIRHQLVLRALGDEIMTDFPTIEATYPTNDQAAYELALDCEMDSK